MKYKLEVQIPSTPGTRGAETLEERERLCGPRCVPAIPSSLLAHVENRLKVVPGLGKEMVGRKQAV